MKNRILLISFFLCFVCASIHAQNNFEPAYIITLENDTVEGFANFRSDLLNLSGCEFKEQLEENSIIYHPTNISGYGFHNEGKIYTSQTINIEGRERTVFLEYMVKGLSTSLFFYQENAEKHIFVVKDIYGDFHPITKKEGQLVDGSINIKKDVSFRQSLYKVLGYNPEMQGILKKTEFTRRSMTEVVKKHNDITCSPDDESCVVYQAKSKKYLKLNYAIYAGARFIKRTTKKSEFISSSSPMGYEIGAQLILSYPRISNSLSFIVDISLSQLKQNILATHPVPPMWRYGNYKYSATALDIALGFKYIYPKGKLRPGFGIGLGRMYIFNQKVKTTAEDNSNEWLENSYTEFTCNLSLDYIIKENRSIFLQFNYDTEIDSFHIETGKYTLRGRIGYKF